MRKMIPNTCRDIARLGLTTVGHSHNDIEQEQAARVGLYYEAARLVRVNMCVYLFVD